MERRKTSQICQTAWLSACGLDRPVAAAFSAWVSFFAFGIGFRENKGGLGLNPDTIRPYEDD